MTSIEKNTPQAKIVNDRFHVRKHLNEAMDKVRRQEQRELSDAARVEGIQCRNWVRNATEILALASRVSKIPLDQ